MSYILDALKKSEKERQQGTVPDLMTIQDAMVQEPKKRSLLPYLLLVALVLNAALLGWWLISLQSKKPRVVTYSPDSQQYESNPDVNLSPDLSKISGSGVMVKKKVTESETNETKKEVESETTVKQKKPMRVSNDFLEQTSDKLTPTNDRKYLPEISPSAQQQTQTIRHAPSELKPTTKHMTPGKNEIYNIYDLPLSIQQSLPPITISVSLYSDDPDSRMAKVNGLMMKEGEYLTTDLKLEEITPDGIIFCYQSYRFRMGPK